MLKIMVVGSLVAGIVFSTGLHAREVHVIVNKSISAGQIDSSEIRMIFMGKRTSFPSGEEVVPLDASENSQLYADFYRHVLRKTREQMYSYWSRAMFTGSGRPPQQIHETSEAMALVANNKKHIAYVEGKVDPDIVKVVYTINIP